MDGRMDGCMDVWMIYSFLVSYLFIVQNLFIASYLFMMYPSSAQVLKVMQSVKALNPLNDKNNNNNNNNNYNITISDEDIGGKKRLFFSRNGEGREERKGEEEEDENGCLDDVECQSVTSSISELAADQQR